MNIQILGYKNKYNITTMQLKIDYDKKIFSIGSFTIINDKTLKTKKEFYNKIEELKMLNFKEVK